MSLFGAEGDVDAADGVRALIIAAQHFIIETHPIIATMASNVRSINVVTCEASSPSRLSCSSSATDMSLVKLSIIAHHNLLPSDTPMQR